MAKRLRRIPYGTMNWELIVRECHFVDNTAYIRRLEEIRTPVFLRPKRFGKSMVCSMLAHYCDVALRDRFDELFGMTEIGREPADERNSYLVLTFDFSTVQVGTIAQIEERFTDNVRGAVGVFAARYAKFADWSNAVNAANAAGMIDRLRDVIKTNNLPPLPDPETKRQALAYRDALLAKPDWGSVPLDAVVVHVNSSRGHDWIPVAV